MLICKREINGKVDFDLGFGTQRIAKLLRRLGRFKFLTLFLTLNPILPQFIERANLL